MLVIGVALLVLTASVLPVTWVWWYVHDEDPYRHADRAHAL